MFAELRDAYPNVTTLMNDPTPAETFDHLNERLQEKRIMEMGINIAYKLVYSSMARPEGVTEEDYIDMVDEKVEVIERTCAHGVENGVFRLGQFFTQNFN
jgi:hypothetical protein